MRGAVTGRLAALDFTRRHNRAAKYLPVRREQ
jgi:hypothetical protein